MKTTKLLILIHFTLLFTSCEEKKNIKEVENSFSAKMKIGSVGLSNLSYTDPYWSEGDKIGLYLNTSSNSVGTSPYRGNYDNYNLPSTFKNGAWQTDHEVYLTDAKSYLFAYYPYDSEAPNNGLISMDMAKQTDYMRGSHTAGATLDIDKPNANITMQHICALLRFPMRKSQHYKGEGKVTAIEVCHNNEVSTSTRRFYTQGTFNIVTASSTPNYGSDSSLKFNNPDGILTLKTEFSTSIPEIIVLPISSATTQDGVVLFKFTIDGVVHTWELPKNSSFTSGNAYTYNVIVGTGVLEISNVSKVQWKDNTAKNLFIETEE